MQPTRPIPSSSANSSRTDAPQPAAPAPQPPAVHARDGETTLMTAANQEHTATVQRLLQIAARLNPNHEQQDP